MQSNARNVVLDTRQCAAPNEADCYSDYWGEHTIITPQPMPGDADPNGANVIDQAELSAEQWNTLRLPGRLIAEHATFLSTKVAFLLDATLGMINIEQNNVIKILTVASVAFLPPMQGG